MLKTTGRVGQAAMYGAGCYADANVATTTSGVGEYLIRTSLAKQFAEDLLGSEANVPASIKLAFDNSFTSKFCI